MTWFMLAMIAYPEVQKKCQEELDRVVGRSRMPTFKDKESLPYIRATLRELLRWRTPTPIGEPSPNMMSHTVLTSGRGTALYHAGGFPLSSSTDFPGDYLILSTTSRMTGMMDFSSRRERCVSRTYRMMSHIAFFVKRISLLVQVSEP